MAVAVMLNAHSSSELLHYEKFDHISLSLQTRIFRYYSLFVNISSIECVVWYDRTEYRFSEL